MSRRSQLQFASTLNALAGPAGLAGVTPMLGTSRLGAAAQTILAGKALFDVAHNQYKAWRDGRAYEISVTSGDRIYNALHAWMLAQIPPSEQRALMAYSRSVQTNGSRNVPPSVHGDPLSQIAALSSAAPGWAMDDDDDYDPDDYDDEGARIREKGLAILYRYDGSEDRKVYLGRHLITVSVGRMDAEDLLAGQHQNQEGKYEQTMKITLSAQSEGGARAIKRLLTQIASSMSVKARPQTFMPSSYGWSATNNIILRKRENVILADGVWEALSGDLQQFLASESLYARIGIPWHRGYLLDGPPGTGKTSTALALAHEHRMNVHYLPLPDVKSDTDLITLFSRIGQRSMLLIEDFDAQNAAVTREGLLNALDGAVTPHGLVIVLTTNHPQDLDPALVRKGRVDRQFHLGYLGQDQLEQLVTHMTGAPLPHWPMLQPHVKIAPSDIAEVVKQHIRDMSAARHATYEYLLAQGCSRPGVSALPSRRPSTMNGWDHD